MQLKHRLNEQIAVMVKSEMLVACLPLCDPMDCSLTGSSVHEILQARILEWVTMPFSKDLPNPGVESALQADSLPSEPPGKPINILYSFTTRSILIHCTFR